MKNIVVIIGLLFSHYAHALDEWHVAIIDDPDGYVFVRSGPGKENPVIDTIAENTFFYCVGDTSKFWISVQNPVDGKMGYMHRSRIAFFYQLDSARQHKLILEAFRETVENSNSYWTKVKNCPKEEIIFLNRERDRIYEEKYAPAYDALGKLFCKQPDSVLLCAFFKTLLPLSGSADEGISDVSFHCWSCHQQFVENIVCHWSNEEERKFIISKIETGDGYDPRFSPPQMGKKFASLEKKCN